MAAGAAMLIAQPASSQSASDPDARYAVIGPGSVEPRTGNFTYQATDLSVGVGAFPGTIELTRWTRTTVDYGLNRPLGDFDHNFEISTGCESFQSSAPSPCFGRRVVRIGPNAYLFTLTASNTWESAYGEGAGLVEDTTRFIFRGPQGDQIIFPKSSDFYNFAGTVNLAASWQTANGESLIFTYEIALNAAGGWKPVRRLSQVVNSRGYGIKFNYLLPGNGTPGLNYTNTDWRRMTIASAEAIAPGCTPGTTVDCDTTRLGRVEYIYSDRPGTSTTYSLLRLDTVKDPEGNETSLIWADRLLAAETNPAVPGAFRFQNSYVSNAVTQQIDPLENIWLFRRTPDASGNIVAEVEDPLHAITRYSYVAGKTAPEWIEDPGGRRTKFVYDNMGRTESVESPLGKKATYTYDTRGNVTNVLLTPAPGVATAQAQVTTSSVYPACDATNWKICNKPVSVTDARNATTEFSYNLSHGGMEAILGPGDGAAGSRSLVKYSYGSFTRAPGVEASSSAAPLPDVVLRTGSEICLSSNDTVSYVCPAADSISAHYNYDASTPSERTQFLMSSVTADPGGIAATIAQQYDIVGNIVRVDGPRNDGDIATFSYNRNRATTHAVAPDPDGSGPVAAPETNYDYDAAGQQTAVRRRMGATEFVTSVLYNAAGQVKQVSDPLSGVVDLSYDNAGRPFETSQTVEGVVRRARQVYDVAGRVTETRSGVGTSLEGAIVTTSYDPDGSVTSQSDANGNTTNYCVDGFGRTVEVRYPSLGIPGTSASCATSPAGSLASSADFESFGYDAAGNLISRHLRDGQVISFQYDALGRVKFKDVPEADRDVTYTYDLAGRMKSASLPGTNASLSVSSEYDAIGRIVSTTSAGRTLVNSYPAGGLSTSLTWPDQKSAVYHSDPLGRTTSIYGPQEQVGAPLLATYFYDQLSRRTGIVRGNQTQTTFSYDTQGRLSSLSHDLTGASYDVAWGFTYNEAGQLKTRSRPNDAYAWPGAQNVSRDYQRNGLNQYDVSGTVALGYDPRGNLTIDGPAAYGYDSENRLISAGTATLAYDAVGRLARLTSGGIVTSFLYDRTRLVGEYDGNGSLVRRYVHGPGTDEPIAWYEHSGSTDSLHWLYPDERGSVVAIADRDGAIVNVNSYNEYGIPSQNNYGLFQYTGQAWLPQIGLYYYKARFYSADLGRFLQTDPIGYADGMNLYAYAGNDPVNAGDPSGLASQPTEETIIVTGTRIRLPGLSGSDALAGARFFNQWQGYAAAAALARNANPLNWPHGERPPSAQDSCKSAVSKVITMSRGAAYAGTSEEQAFLNKYAAGDQSPVRLSPAQFERASTWIEARIRSKVHIYDESNKDRTGSWTATINFGGSIHNPEFNFLLGQATGYFEGDQLVGIRDQFEFKMRSYGSDWQSRATAWGVNRAREIIAEGCPNSNPGGFPVTGGNQR